MHRTRVATRSDTHRAAYRQMAAHAIPSGPAGCHRNPEYVSCWWTEVFPLPGRLYEPSNQPGTSMATPARTGVSFRRACSDPRRSRHSPVLPRTRRSDVVIVEQRSLKSSNPVLSRSSAMCRSGMKTAAGRDHLVQATVGVDWDGSLELLPRRPRPGLDPVPAAAPLLTLEAVVRRTAAALSVAAVAAGLGWTCRPADARIGYVLAGALALVAALLTVARRRSAEPAPALTFAFAACGGAFLGLLPGAVAVQTSSGACLQTVLGTMAASAGVLTAYRLRLIRMTRRFRGYVLAGVLAAALLAGADRVAVMTAGPDSLGLHSAHDWVIGGLCALAGILLTTPGMSIHVQRIEEMINEGLPDRSCWTAAFGLTLTPAWSCVEAVRALTLASAEDLYFW
ncbi:Bax inhibitor-1/YccA family protein [Kitasatospora sp. NPDC057223]|uniref:Bax inhibitor-1/YccA family membrane protein n=1 Tax=Kitasatospora sp. NPDC057223 TaxID=3346055 RepID=UPI00364440F9